MLILLQVLGACTGVAGSFMVTSQRRKRRRLGFVLFTVSNLCWISVSLLLFVPGLLVMNLAFMATSITGIWTNRLRLKPPGWGQKTADQVDAEVAAMRAADWDRERVV